MWTPTSRDVAVFNESLDLGYNNTDYRFWQAYQADLQLGGPDGIIGALARDNLDAVLLPSQYSYSFAAIVGTPIVRYVYPSLLAHSRPSVLPFLASIKRLTTLSPSAYLWAFTLQARPKHPTRLVTLLRLRPTCRSASASWVPSGRSTIWSAMRMRMSRRRWLEVRECSL